MVEEELLDAEDELKAKLGGETKAKDQEDKPWTAGDAWIQAFLLLDQRQGKDEGANVKDDQTDQRKKKFFCTFGGFLTMCLFRSAIKILLSFVKGSAMLCHRIKGTM